MIAYWVTGKKGAEQRSEQAKPLDDGRYCRITDLEDGSFPVRTYGQTPDEVYSKIEKTSMHARLRLTDPARTNPTPAAPPKPAPARRLTLTADEQLLATSELSNPAKAPGALVRLFESATGIDTEQQAARAFEERALQWEGTHPELKNAYFNKKLIADNARMRVGGNIRLVTVEVLEQCYQDLKAGGYLLTEEDLPNGHQPPALPVPPEENPASRTRQTDPGFATSHRLNRTGLTQLPQWKPKYTREEIDRMPLRESERLLKAGDKDYADAVNYHYPPRQARA